METGITKDELDQMRARATRAGDAIGEAVRSSPGPAVAGLAALAGLQAADVKRLARHVTPEWAERD